MPTDTQLINQWLEHHERERGRSTRTLYTYSQDAKRLLTHLFGSSLSLSQASTDDLRGWVHAPLVKGSLAGQAPMPATIKRKVSTLRSLYGFLHAEGLVGTNPAARLFAPKVSNENPRPVDLGTWRTLWGSDLSDADRVGLGLALFLGLRRSEVVSVTADMFGPTMLTEFRRKGGKLGTVPWLSCVTLFEERDATLLGGSSGSFVNPLNRLLASRPGGFPLVPFEDEPLRACTRAERSGSIDPQALNRRLKRALRRSGEDPAAFTPHQLRHTFCTLLIDWDVPLLVVSRLAGHANQAVTERYIQTREDPLAVLLASRAEVEVKGFSRI